MDARFFQRTYDAFAARYDADFEAQQTPKIRGLLAAMQGASGPWLDAGAGTGLATRIAGVPFVALDASAGMLRHAGGQRVQGDVYRLPFKDAAFGAVICVTALIDFDDPRPAVDELMRVLKPEGWIGISVLAHERIERLWQALARYGDPRRLNLAPDVGFVVRRSTRQAP